MNNINKGNIKGKKITVYQDGEVVEKNSQRKVKKVKLDCHMNCNEIDLLLVKMDEKLR